MRRVLDYNCSRVLSSFSFVNCSKVSEKTCITSLKFYLLKSARLRHVEAAAT